MRQTLARRTLLIAAATGAMSMSASAAANNESAGNETNETTESAPTNDETGEDYVRLTHLSPDTGPVDLYASGDRVFNGVEHIYQEDYVTYAPDQSVPVHVTPAGEPIENAILETEVSMTGGPVSLTLIGESCESTDRPLKLLPVYDNYSDLVSDHARLKAVHASPDAPSLDFRMDDGTELITGVEYGDYGFSTIPVGEQVLAVHKAGEEQPLARFNIEPDANSVYSAFAVGYLNPNSAPSAVGDFPLGLGVVADTAPSDQ